MIVETNSARGKKVMEEEGAGYGKCEENGVHGGHGASSRAMPPCS